MKRYVKMISFLVVFISMFTIMSDISYYTNGTSSNVYAVNKALNNTSDISITISAVGDCTLAADSKENYKNSFYNVIDMQKGNYDYFFKNVKGVFLQDDITIANFEGTLTSAEKMNPKKYHFKGKSEYAKILKSGGVDIVNLSNNHILDYGQIGKKDTIAALNKYNISYFGAGNKTIKSVKGIKIGFLGYEWWVSSSALKKSILRDIQEMKKKTDMIVVSFHGGQEGVYKPTEAQKTLGRYAIDCGAELVIGHHPHVLQGIENYKGKAIVYSLGNFCYGGNITPPDKRTMIFQEKLTFDKNKKIKNTSHTIIPCKLSSVEDINNYQPILLTGETKNKVLFEIEKLGELIGK